MKVVGLGLLKHLEWPEGRPSPSAVRDASFNLGHVLFIKVGRAPLAAGVCSVQESRALTQLRA